ncbi:hypothetical protein SAMN05216600_1289 [Pseudomonas cuatrocienegasensis]|uniref:Secreted protein n=1 Tax=Pseudomonas cuatrocienegasensis TaxID=543360 RepID=A0ABY1BQU2_9PSED|nr:hypothetical protein SAMN05216600_1289 [Pseudomonas cuatrocienegasensis]
MQYPFNAFSQLRLTAFVLLHLCALAHRANPARDRAADTAKPCRLEAAAGTPGTPSACAHKEARRPTDLATMRRQVRVVYQLPGAPRAGLAKRGNAMVPTPRAGVHPAISLRIQPPLRQAATLRARESGHRPRSNSTKRNPSSCLHSAPSAARSIANAADFKLCQRGDQCLSQFDSVTPRSSRRR